MKKENTKKTVVDKTPRMSYESYAYLRDMMDFRMEKLVDDFRAACNFIPSEPYEHGKLSSVDKAYRIFSDEYAKLRQIKEELHLAAQAMYKDHPNLEMRKFWGLKE